MSRGTFEARAAFEAAAAGRMVLHHACARAYREGQTLKLTGWHMDGTPFACVSARFEGNIRDRAHDMALDLMRLHYGEFNMPAPAAVKGLAGSIKASLAAVTKAADELRAEAEGAASEFVVTVTEGRELVKDIKASTAEVKATLGLNSNGGPHGPLPGAEPQSSSNT